MSCFEECAIVLAVSGWMGRLWKDGRGDGLTPRPLGVYYVPWLEIVWRSLCRNADVFLARS